MGEGSEQIRVPSVPSTHVTVTRSDEEKRLASLDWMVKEVMKVRGQRATLGGTFGSRGCPWLLLRYYKLHPLFTGVVIRSDTCMPPQKNPGVTVEFSPCSSSLLPHSAWQM